MAITAAFRSRAIVAVGVAAAGLAGLAALRTDLLVSRSFDHALDVTRPGLTFDAAAGERRQGVAVGDEGFWLTRAEVESPAPFAKPLAVGDRIAITGADGRERRLEVMDLKVIGGDPIRAVRGVAVRLMLVTCRVTEDNGERSDAQVRFIVEAEPAPPAAPAPAKSL